MSTWHRDGTVDVTNGSTTVTGTGTNFNGTVKVGDAAHLPDGRSYEITGIVSDTEITLARGFLGSTATGQDYAIQPTRGILQDFNDTALSLISTVQGYVSSALAGLFGDGTAGTPGIGFSGDTDTGLYRPGSNQLAATTGGTRRWLLSSTAMQIDVPITGSAVQSGSEDTTAGRLMTVGAFGLGSLTGGVLSQPDGNAELPAGFYGGGGGGAANFPGAAGFRPFLAMSRRASSSNYMAARMFLDGGAIPVLRESVDSGATWSADNTIYGTANLLGTVSETSGTPTGAVIERGSNANGEYVRFADGTQICTSAILADNVSGGFLETTWTFPAGFSERPSIAVTPIHFNDGAASGSGTYNGAVLVAPATRVTGANSVQIYVYGEGTWSTGDAVDLHVTATSRWF